MLSVIGPVSLPRLSEISLSLESLCLSAQKGSREEYGTPMVFYCALPILRSAAMGLWNRQIRMEVLLSLGFLAAYGLSIAQTLLGRTHLYLLAGKLIERGAKERAMRSIATLYRLMPKKVRTSDRGEERFVSIDALQPDAVFIVNAGERIPADGTILEGQTQTDESLLTGEFTPVSKIVGDTVISGSLNAGGVIKVRALCTGEDSTLAQIIRTVERAMSNRAPLERSVDRVSRVFVPAVITLASATFVVLMFAHLPAGVASFARSLSSSLPARALLDSQLHWQLLPLWVLPRTVESSSPTVGFSSRWERSTR